MPVMNVTSFNKEGEQIKTKEVVLKNDNVYKILKKYIQKPVVAVKEEQKVPVSA